MYLVRNHNQFVNRLLISATRRSFMVAGIALVLLLVAIAIIMVWNGAPIMNGRPWDVPTLLDGAWRITNGQVPHRDFYSHLGAFPFYLTRLGMKLSQPCLSAIVYGNVVLMAILALTSAAILARRTSALYAFLFSMFVGLLVVTPRPLGDPYDYNDYAMLYNRFGEALLALFSVLAFLPPAQPGGRRVFNILEGFVMGLLLVGLWFDKLNYFVIAVFFFVLAGALRFPNTDAVLACIVSAPVILGLVLIITDIPLGAMIGDFRITAGAQSPGNRLATLAIQTVKAAPLLPLLLLITWESMSGRGRKQTGWLFKFREWFLPLALFGGALLLLSSNCQVGEMPLLAVAGLYGAEMIRRTSLATDSTEYFFTGVRNVAGLCLMLFFLLPTPKIDLMALRNCTFAAFTKDFVTSDVLKTTALRDFRFAPNGTRSQFSREYMESLDEGIQLVRRHASPDMRLMVAMFTDPFNVALGLRPPEGGLTCWDTIMLNQRSHPPLKRLVGNSTHILALRKQSAQKETYGDEWDALGLETVEETKRFVLLKVSQVAARSLDR